MPSAISVTSVSSLLWFLANCAIRFSLSRCIPAKSSTLWVSASSLSSNHPLHSIPPVDALPVEAYGFRGTNVSSAGIETGLVRECSGGCLPSFIAATRISIAIPVSGET